MAKRGLSIRRKGIKKKTLQGRGTRTKYGNKGGGPKGSTKSKHYKKRSRGQGKR